MKNKAFIKALRFACLPTLSLLLLLYFVFFDITKTINFIASDNVIAIVLRVLLLIGEFVLIYTMYSHYLDEMQKDAALKPDVEKIQFRSAPSHYNLRDIFQSDSTSDYYIANTEHKDFKIIKIKRNA